MVEILPSLPSPPLPSQSQLGQDTAQTHQEVVQLVDGYCRLAEAGSGAIATAESQQVHKIRTAPNLRIQVYMRSHVSA